MLTPKPSPSPDEALCPSRPWNGWELSPGTAVDAAHDLGQEPLGHLGPASPGQDCWLAHQLTVTGPRTLSGWSCQVDCLFSSGWRFSHQTYTSCVQHFPTSVAPHSPNTCIYNKILDCVSLDFRWAPGRPLQPLVGSPVCQTLSWDPCLASKYLGCGSRQASPCVTLGQPLSFVGPRDVQQSSHWPKSVLRNGPLIIPYLQALHKVGGVRPVNSGLGVVKNQGICLPLGLHSRALRRIWARSHRVEGAMTPEVAVWSLVGIQFLRRTHLVPLLGLTWVQILPPSS